MSTIPALYGCLGMTHNFRTTSHCYSKPVLDSKKKKSDKILSARFVLGITCNPRDSIRYPSIPVPTPCIHFRKAASIQKNNSWRNNGAIQRLKPGSNSLAKNSPEFGEQIISNLPVSKHDIYVNYYFHTKWGSSDLRRWQHN